jgi:recombination associated protein RdgC
MWFKNLCLYHYPEEVDLAAEMLEEKLAEKAATPLGKHTLSTVGWAPPLGSVGETFTHVIGHYVMLCMQKEEKILPAAAIREEVDTRIGQIEEKESRQVRAKEKRDLKDEVILDMIPRAFNRTVRTYAYLDLKNRYFVVDAASPKRAEEVVMLLRETLDSFPAKPVQVKNAPDALMTDWLARNALAGDFTIDEECELRDEGEDGGIVRIRKQDLTAEEVQAHLAAGKRVRRLAMTYDERIAFVLDAAMDIKRLRFLDIVQEQAENEDLTTFAELFDSDFAIMSVELNRFLARLFELLGGVVEE